MYMFDGIIPIIPLIYSFCKSPVESWLWPWSHLTHWIGGQFGRKPRIFFLWQKPWCVQWRFSPKSKPIYWKKCTTPDLAFHLSTVCAIALPGFASQYSHRCHDKSALSLGEWKLKTSLLLGPGWVNWYPKTVVFVLKTIKCSDKPKCLLSFLTSKAQGGIPHFRL